MISSRNRLVQVKISAFAYEFIRKYSEIFNGSISKFCENAINEKILSIGGLPCSDVESADAHAEEDVITKENVLETFL